MHRNIRASFFNDFFVEKLDMIINAPVGKQTVEVAEARKMLKDLGIPIDSMITLSGKMTNKRIKLVGWISLKRSETVNLSLDPRSLHINVSIVS